jgi:hypothetical protein
MCSTLLECTNGLSARKIDEEINFDLILPDTLDFEVYECDTEIQNLAASLFPTEKKRQREDKFRYANESPSSKRLRTEDVSDILHITIGDDDFIGEDTFPANDNINIELEDFFHDENVLPPPEIDIDEFLYILDHDVSPKNVVQLPAELPRQTNSTIPLPSKKWLGHSVVNSSPAKEKKVTKQVLVPHLISVKKVYVEERTLSTAQKASHKQWATKRKRCLTGFRGHKCPAKSKAAKSKVRNNGRFE